MKPVSAPPLLSMVASTADRLCGFIWLRIRVVPLIVFCAGLLLTVKVNKIWSGIFEITGVEAADNESIAPPLNNTPSPSNKASSDKTSTPINLPSPSKENEVKSPKTNSDIDVFSLTPEEFSVLNSLAKRQDKLDEQALRVQNEEKAFAIKQALLDQKLKELENLKSQLEKQSTEVKTKNEAGIKELAQSYEKMKPADAAEIFDRLQPALTVELLKLIKPDKKASIIAKMKRENAANSTEDYVQLRKPSNPSLSALPTTAEAAPPQGDLPKNSESKPMAKPLNPKESKLPASNTLSTSIPPGCGSNSLKGIIHNPILN